MHIGRIISVAQLRHGNKLAYALFIAWREQETLRTAARRALIVNQRQSLCIMPGNVAL